ncbi:MAG: SHD1 domain-containing protein, partial [Pirellulales bacterium]
LRKQAEELVELRAILRREQEAARIEAHRRGLRAEQVARRDQQRTKPAAKRASRPAARAYRVWSAAEGDFRLEATFVSIDRGIVRLQRPDGRQATVALDQLAPADQQLVRSLLAGAAHTSPGSNLRTR